MKKIFAASLAAISMLSFVPSGIAQAAPRPTFLSIYDITCQTTEDNGNDEIYLTIDGYRAWGGNDGVSVAAGQSRHVGIDKRFDNPSMNISLFDEDWPDSDDHLGTVTVHQSEIGQGRKVAYFTLDGAHYTMYYEVS